MKRLAGAVALTLLAACNQSPTIDTAATPPSSVPGRTRLAAEVAVTTTTRATTTSARPVSPPRASRRRAPGAGTPTSSRAPIQGDVWSALARCESGGNPRAIGGGGRYFGLYQFSLATWRSVGGSGNPIDASPAEQTSRAQALQARSGWGQWPVCSRKLGLR